MDPFEQLDLARKITSMAIASRVSNLDSEVVELRQKLLDKDNVVRELEEKASLLERDCGEADSRLKVVLEDNTNLTKEKDLLAMTVTKLTRDLAKQTKHVDVRTWDQSVTGSYPGKAERTNVHSITQSYNGSADMNNPTVEA